MKLMSSRTWSRGSPPRTSIRSRAGPATISSLRTKSSVVIGFGPVVVFRQPVGHVRADLLEVALERRDHGVHVAPAEGREDGDVEIGRPLRVRAGHDERDVGPGERLERAPDADERGVVGELEDPAVEPRRRPRRPPAPSSSRAAACISSTHADSSSRSSSLSRGTASRAPSDSSAVRIAYASSSSRRVGRRTRAPRNGVISTTPSASRPRRASRTGAWLVPSSRATCVSTIRESGANRPVRIPSSRRSLTWSARTLRGRSRAGSTR